MTVILLRHGRSSANTAATLAGRTPGIGLDEVGREQSARVRERLAGLPLSAIVTSPLQRCRETVAGLAGDFTLTPQVDDRLAEVDYGDWTGRPLTELVTEPLWQVVQQQPSAVVFPGGEALAQVQARAVSAVRAHDQALRAGGEADRLWVACTHGDVIKSVLADALGLHLDSFQRIMTVPAAISVISYTDTRPVVHHMNDTGSDLSALARLAGAAAGVQTVPGGETGTA